MYKDAILLVEIVKNNSDGILLKKDELHVFMVPDPHLHRLSKGQLIPVRILDVKYRDFNNRVVASATPYFHPKADIRYYQLEGKMNTYNISNLNKIIRDIDNIKLNTNMKELFYAYKDSKKPKGRIVRLTDILEDFAEYEGKVICYTPELDTTEGKVIVYELDEVEGTIIKENTFIAINNLLMEQLKNKRIVQDLENIELSNTMTKLFNVLKL